ncbi:MAG: hypothetical protein AAGI24_04040 [Pseudomonadota bacterium]
MARVDRSYIGKGPVYFKVKGNDGGLFPIGNCSNLEVSFDEEEQSLRDFTSPGGGNANILTSISAVSGNLVMHDYSADNLALALRGSVVQETAGAVSDEPHSTNGVDGEFIPFDFIRDATQPLTVTLTDTSALAEGTDYSVENNGIIVIGTGAIDATGILVDYTKAVSEVMESLTDAGGEYELVFNGLNEAQSGKAVDIRMHRVKFSPAQGLSFIGEEFGEMSVDFELLSDQTITGAGISRFMKVSQAL